MEKLKVGDRIRLFNILESCNFNRDLLTVGFTHPDKPNNILDYPFVYSNRAHWWKFSQPLTLRPNEVVQVGTFIVKSLK